MALELANYEEQARAAVQLFWASRTQAAARQASVGKQDQGQRGSVTGGKNMDGFLVLVKEIIRANGLANAEVHEQRRLLTLPGYFRPRF